AVAGISRASVSSHLWSTRSESRVPENIDRTAVDGAARPEVPPQPNPTASLATVSVSHGDPVHPSEGSGRPSVGAQKDRRAVLLDVEPVLARPPRQRCRSDHVHEPHL